MTRLIAPAALLLSVACIADEPGEALGTSDAVAGLTFSTDSCDGEGGCGFTSPEGACQALIARNEKYKLPSRDPNPMTLPLVMVNQANHLVCNYWYDSGSYGPHGGGSSPSSHPLTVFVNQQRRTVWVCPPGNRLERDSVGIFPYGSNGWRYAVGYYRGLYGHKSVALNRCENCPDGSTYSEDKERCVYECQQSCDDEFAEAEAARGEAYFKEMGGDLGCASEPSSYLEGVCENSASIINILWRFKNRGARSQCFEERCL